MDKLEISDHIYVSRFGYTHHGLYIGHGRVIHYSGTGKAVHTGPVEEVSLEVFSEGQNIKIRIYDSRKFDRYDSVSRARRRLGEDLYNLFNNNCEHFVEWCINGDHESEQVNFGTKIGGASAGGAAAVAGVGVVATTGAAAGLSGAGIMSGLATIGGAVGGGAVAGIAVAAATPAALTALVVNSTVLGDNEAHDQKERSARRVGRAASYTGAAAGTAGSIAAVSALGATTGLSAAGITSGLATLGTTTGAASVASVFGFGAMTGGVAVAIGGPVLAATAAGYGVYKIFKWLKN